MRTVRHAASRPRFVTLLALVGIAVAACDSGGSDDDSGTPNTPPPTTPPPPPPPAADVPPLASTATSLDGVGVVGTMYWNNGMHTPDGGQGGPVDGLTCEATSPVGYHVHAHLSIFMSGDQLMIPSRIGFVEPTATSECHYPMHTHNRSGIVHMHASAPTDFTLGQFFEIWGRPLERDNVADFTNMPIRFFVVDEDNVVEEHTGDPAEILLIDHRDITIQIGAEDLTEIPDYVWTQAGD
jgi:hypothetical protein